MKHAGARGAFRRGGVSTLLLMAALGTTATAWAQDETDAPAAAKPPSDKKRVLVGKLAGAKTESAREWIV